MAGAKHEKGFFIGLNMQNPPRPAMQMWYVRNADKDSVFEHTVCGYEFTVDRRKDSFGIAEGYSEFLNFRMAFIPEKGHYWVSRDFSGQELRILANIAQEPTLIKTFLENGDPHKATAIALWGEENYSKEKRKAAKAINFGLIYGKTAQSFAEDFGVSTEEAQKYVDNYFDKLPNVKRFLNSCVREAAQTKMISNLYGRKRRLHRYIDQWGNLESRGKRISYNFPIQSMGAEVTKIALIKLYNNLIADERYKDKIYFRNTIHDEINTSIEFSIIEEAAKKLGDLMVHVIPNTQVPIIAGLEIGHSMGLTWKFEQNPETLKLVPVYEPLEESDTK